MSVSLPGSEAGMRAEQRSTERVGVTGSVIVGLGGVTHGRLVDLSAGGVRFELAPGSAPYVPGTTLVIDVRLDGARFGWFRFVAVITRSMANETAATFTDVPAEFAEAVRCELRVAAAGVDTCGVLLVDVDTPRRILLAAALRITGFDVTEVATPLEAISYLDDSQARPWIVAIADTMPSSIADELRAHMRSAHALVRLLTLGEATVLTGASPLNWGAEVV